MDLKIKDVAELLNVSETTIRRWLLDGKIPAYKLNRQYRFSRIEIENWMLRQKVSQAPSVTPLIEGETQIFPKEEKGPHSGNQQFSFYRALNQGGIYHSVPGKKKGELIKNAMKLIAPKLSLDPTMATDLLMDRERLMPTALNNGVAVPHARECLHQVSFDFVGVVLPAHPIEYGALDEKPVDILFFLFAAEDKRHLHLLSKIAHLSNDETSLTFLRGGPEKPRLLDYIRKWEGALRLN